MPEEYQFRQHRTMTACSFDVRSYNSFAVIPHRFFLKSVRIPAKNLHHLTSKSAARSNADHCAVQPLFFVGKESCS